MRTESEIYVATDYSIVYEDDFFMVADKPAPLPVHAVGRFKEKNLLSLLKRDFAFSASGLRIVNRLDSETSGLVLAAKSGEAAGRLGILFERRQVVKEYRAVVFGTPDPVSGSISLRLGFAIQNSHRLRVVDPEGEEARTDYEVLESWKAYSLLKLNPKTGRMHQLRAHLAYSGYPIVGDKIYIDSRIFERYVQEGWQEDMRTTVQSDRLLLHASKLEFEHPWTHQKMQFVSHEKFSKPQS